MQAALEASGPYARLQIREDEVRARVAPLARPLERARERERERVRERERAGNGGSGDGDVGVERGRTVDRMHHRRLEHRLSKPVVVVEKAAAAAWGKVRTAAKKRFGKVRSSVRASTSRTAKTPDEAAVEVLEEEEEDDDEGALDPTGGTFFHDNDDDDGDEDGDRGSVSGSTEYSAGVGADTAAPSPRVYQTHRQPLPAEECITVIPPGRTLLLRALVDGTIVLPPSPLSLMAGERAVAHGGGGVAAGADRAPSFSASGTTSTAATDGSTNARSASRNTAAIVTAEEEEEEDGEISEGASSATAVGVALTTEAETAVEASGSDSTGRERYNQQLDFGFRDRAPILPQIQIQPQIQLQQLQQQQQPVVERALMLPETPDELQRILSIEERASAHGTIDGGIGAMKGGGSGVGASRGASPHGYDTPPPSPPPPPREMDEGFDIQSGAGGGADEAPLLPCAREDLEATVIDSSEDSGEDSGRGYQDPAVTGRTRLRAAPPPEYDHADEGAGPRAKGIAAVRIRKLRNLLRRKGPPPIPARDPTDSNQADHAAEESTETTTAGVRDFTPTSRKVSALRAWAYNNNN